MIAFPDWMKQYDAFKAVLKPILMKDLPTEAPQLSMENGAMPKFLSAAREHEALGAYFYREFRDKKQSMAQVTWAQKDSAGLADAVKARAVAISVAMRPQA